MKARFGILLAVALLVIGALAGRALSFGSNGSPGATASQTPSTAVSRGTTAAAAPAALQSADISAAAIDAATEHAYAVASPSVVYVENVGTGSGSGVIYDMKGDIVTNDHVVQGASSLKVTLNDGRQFSAQLVGTDGADDLAVIRIHASGLTPAAFATPGSYHVAQTVLAIGSPLGLKDSVTSGLISGLGRVEQEPSGSYLPNAIQTSAAINPGNSGGALVTLDGVVVGMPTLVQTSTSDGTSAQNIGFAVPSSRITDVADQIIATGKVEHTGRAFLGISPTDPSSQSLSPFGFGQGGGTTPQAGAVVSQVSADGPAGKAGIQVGDTITSVDGTSISNAEDLLTILATKHPGDTVSLKVDRDGSAMSFTVKLGELPA